MSQIGSIAPNNIVGDKMRKEEAWNNVPRSVEGILRSKKADVIRLARNLPHLDVSPSDAGD